MWKLHADYGKRERELSKKKKEEKVRKIDSVGSSIENLRRWMIGKTDNHEIWQLRNRRKEGSRKRDTFIFSVEKLNISKFDLEHMKK